jgi:predicted  nucleic acid-binding Zn-ribbon protein
MNSPAKCQAVPCPKCGGKGWLYVHERSPEDWPHLPPPLRERECDECDGWREVFRDIAT